MSRYAKVVGWTAFFVVNCYAWKWIFAALSYNSDPVFFAGLAAAVLLAWTDGEILFRAFKKWLSKEETPVDEAKPAGEKEGVRSGDPVGRKGEER